ncbi:hypothetical protein SCAR479_01021 [Seiridium cardinale]|uniref:Ubiquitin-like domain-containing protein n=1 Tax=Seiridium cardinale TaxID=138064 RepID=A0ABR2Y7G2_9PEZI
MSATFTYGSFGDLITTVQLVWRLSQALSDSYGSAQEFQDLVVELNLFYGSLHEGPELESLIRLVKPAVAACRNAIEPFLQKAFKKYGKSLMRPKGSRKSILDMIKRIQWSIFEKDKVTQMRDSLRRNKDVIDMVQSLAQGWVPLLDSLQVMSVANKRRQSITQEQDSNIVAVRLASLADAEAQASARVEEQFGDVLKILKEQATTTARIDENVIAVLSEFIPAALDPYARSYAFIEDALGHTFPIHLGTNPSWETVRSMIRDQFRGRAGMELVMREKYLIQDLNTGEDLRSDMEFYETVRAGQTLTMAMIFSGGRHGGVDSICPKCDQVQAVKTLDRDTICNNSRCSFVYRRVLEVSDATEDHLEEWLAGSKNTKAHDRDLDASNERRSRDIQKS